MLAEIAVGVGIGAVAAAVSKRVSSTTTAAGLSTAPTSTAVTEREVALSLARFLHNAPAVAAALAAIDADAPVTRTQLVAALPPQLALSLSKRDVDVFLSAAAANPDSPPLARDISAFIAPFVLPPLSVAGVPAVAARKPLTIDDLFGSGVSPAFKEFFKSSYNFSLGAVAGAIGASAVYPI
ncbi:hypothetical protein HDU82_004729, partial [Entophlyctis luteolus]